MEEIGLIVACMSLFFGGLFLFFKLTGEDSSSAAEKSAEVAAKVVTAPAKKVVEKVAKPKGSILGAGRFFDALALLAVLGLIFGYGDYEPTVVDGLKATADGGVALSNAALDGGAAFGKASWETSKETAADVWELITYAFYALCIGLCIWIGCMIAPEVWRWRWPIAWVSDIWALAVALDGVSEAWIAVMAISLMILLKYNQIKNH